MKLLDVILQNIWSLKRQSLNCSFRLQGPACREESLHLFVLPVAVSPCYSKMSLCIRVFFFLQHGEATAEGWWNQRGHVWQRLVIWDVGRIAAFSVMLLVRQRMCSELSHVLSLIFQRLGWTANLRGSTSHSKHKAGLLKTHILSYLHTSSIVSLTLVAIFMVSVLCTAGCHGFTGTTSLNLHSC